MPNWVKNDVRIASKQALKDCIKTERRQGEGWEEDIVFFDFNEVIPMPKELESTSKLYPINDKKKSNKELIEKYGADNWYDWSVQNWGTKWNTDNCKKTGVNSVEFNTAWDTPEPVMRELSKKYHTRVEVYYADEDLGNNCGHYVYDDGDIVEDEVGDYELACEIWEYDPEEMEELYGKRV